MAAGKADNFVGEDRSYYQKLVVIVNELINRDIDFLGKKSAADPVDFLSGDLTNGSEGVGLVPLVIFSLFLRQSQKSL